MYYGKKNKTRQFVSAYTEKLNFDTQNYSVYEANIPEIIVNAYFK